MNQLHFSSESFLFKHTKPERHKDEIDTCVHVGFVSFVLSVYFKHQNGLTKDLILPVCLLWDIKSNKTSAASRLSPAV